MADYTAPIDPNVNFDLKDIYTPPTDPNVDFNLVDPTTGVSLQLSELQSKYKVIPSKLGLSELQNKYAIKVSELKLSELQNEYTVAVFALKVSELQNKYKVIPSILKVSELQNKYKVIPSVLKVSELQNKYDVRVANLGLSELQNKYEVQDQKLEAQLNSIYSLRFAKQLDAKYGATVARQLLAMAFYSFSTQLDSIYTIRGDVAKQLDSIYDISDKTFVDTQLDALYSMAIITNQLEGIYSIGPIIRTQLDAKYILSTTPVAKQLDSIYDIKSTNSVVKQLKAIYSILTTQIINITGQPTVTLGTEVFDISDSDIGSDEGSFVWRAKIGILNIEDYVKFEINDEIVFDLYGETFNLVVESKMLSRSGPAQIKMGIIAVSPAIKFDFPRADALDISFTSDTSAEAAAELVLDIPKIIADIIDEDFTFDPGWGVVGDSSVVAGEVVSIINATNSLLIQGIADQTEFRAEFDFRVDTGWAIIDVGKRVWGSGVWASGGAGALTIGIINDGGTLKLVAVHKTDTIANVFTIISSPSFETEKTYEIKLHWKSATAPGANDGIVQMSIDNEEVLNLSNIDSDTILGKFVVLGAQNVSSGITGTWRGDNMKVGTSQIEGIDWQIPDWTIPANRLAIKDGSPIQLVKLIVEAAGGVLESKPDGTLVARPLFPISLPDFDTSTVDQTYTDNSDNMSVSEKYSPTKRLNKFRILDISSQFRDTMEFEFDEITNPNGDIEISTTDGILKIFTSPFRENVIVKSSQEGNVAFQLLGTVTEQLTEQVEFKEGFATLSRPIESVDTIVWEGQNLGALTFTAEDTKIFSASVVNLYGLATITYTTKFIKYRVHGQEKMDTQFRLLEVS